MAREAGSTLARKNVQKSHTQNIFRTYITFGAGAGTEFPYPNTD